MSAVVAETPKLSISLIPRSLLHAVWPQVEKMLVKSCKRSMGRTVLAAIYEELAEGESQLWVAFDPSNDDPVIFGCAITQPNNYVTGMNMLNVEHVAGHDMEQWFPEGLDTIARYARDCGFHGVEALGRPGFWNWMEGKGWKKHAVAYELRFGGSDER